MFNMTQTHPDARQDRRWRDPAFFSLGFRPFFFFAAVLAVLSVAIWSVGQHGIDLIAPAMGAKSWHMHEMIFGYGSAVLTGFLFTAVPNWTKRPPIAGRALIGLLALWLAGRLVLLLPVPETVAGTVDALFMPVVAAVVAREIIGGRNWRNLAVLVPVGVFALANILFHVEVAASGVSDYGMRLGLGALVLLVMLVGGRIVPAFSRNWLTQRKATRLPAAPARFDAASLILGALALIVWVVQPMGLLPSSLLGLAGVVHVLRLSRWAGMETLKNPLLFVLHVAYGMIPVGFLALSFAAWKTDLTIEIAAIHILGVGVIGGMTLSVMIRASLGHSGRPLRADGWTNAAMALIFAAMLARVLAAATPIEAALIDLAALLWIVAFTLFLVRIGPLLFQSRPQEGA